MAPSRLISLAAGTILDVEPADAPSVAAAAGFGAVGIWFDAQTWTAGRAAEVRAALDSAGVVALDVEPIMLTEKGDHGDALVDAAIAIGARNVLVASRDTDHARVADRLNGLAQRLAGTPIRLVLEFLPMLGVRTLDEALSIVAAADHPTLGVLIDSLHLERSGGTIDSLMGVDRRLLPYLQICDAPAILDDLSVAGRLHEALEGRLLPGDGALPIGPLLRAVPEVPLSFEIRSAALRAAYPNPLARARAVAAAAARLND